jgi:hypothetical protein
VVQAPAPLQKADGVNVEPLQDGLPHWTEVGCCWQVPEPLQRPVVPQVPPPTVQRACGSATLAGTLAQVPALPVTLQAWQVEQLALLQQTPSVQLPLEHSWADRQATPFALTGRQEPIIPVQ